MGNLNSSVSIVTPIYGDARQVPSFVNSIKELTKINVIEIILVCDGGGNDDEDFLQEYCKTEKIVKTILLSRNFGQHIAVSAGYKDAVGDLVCMINVDQQDPISEIPKLIKKIEEGAFDAVYGLRMERQDDWFKSLSSKSFNWVLNKLTGDRTPLNVATLRIMTRQFINEYNSLNEKSRYLPGLENWLGFKKGYVTILHKERDEGKSSYTFVKRINLAINSIIGFSDLPLRWTSYLGMLISLLGFAFLTVLLLLKLFLVDFRPGYISTIAVILFVGGIQILVVGLASLYIGRILKEVQNRPLYIVKKKLNFDV